MKAAQLIDRVWLWRVVHVTFVLCLLAGVFAGGMWWERRHAAAEPPALGSPAEPAPPAAAATPLELLAQVEQAHSTREQQRLEIERELKLLKLEYSLLRNRGFDSNEAACRKAVDRALALEPKLAAITREIDKLRELAAELASLAAPQPRDDSATAAELIRKVERAVGTLTIDAPAIPEADRRGGDAIMGYAETP